MQWPIMHAVTYGVSRDQMMARHKANHIQVAYAHSAKEADLAMYAKAAFAAELGLDPHRIAAAGETEELLAAMQQKHAGDDDPQQAQHDLGA